MGFFNNIYKTAKNIDSLSGREFEFLCASVLRENGFSNVKVTPGSGDYGVDIIAEKGGLSYAIQCKHYSKNVGVKAAQEACSGKQYYNCDKAMVLTNSYFTQQAINFASNTNVILWDRGTLTKLIKNSNLQNQNGVRYSVPRRENRTRGASGADPYSCLGKLIVYPIIALIVIILLIPTDNKSDDVKTGTSTVTVREKAGIESSSSEKEILMVITAKNANIRKGPSSKTDVVANAKRDTEFIGTGKSEKADNGGLWYEIYLDESKTTTAWASEQVIKVKE